MGTFSGTLFNQIRRYQKIQSISINKKKTSLKKKYMNDQMYYIKN